jgi:hypothetical protein
MLAKDPSTSHSSLKIIVQKTLLKAFSTSTCIMAQLRCRLKRVPMPKRMASQPPWVETLN